MYLLDTNVISELRKGVRRCDPAVANWFRATGERVCYLSVITLMEIRQGVLRLMRRDQVQAVALDEWLGLVREQYSGRMLPVSDEVALRCAEFHVPNPSSYRDALIGTTALVHRLTVVTRDIDDFQRLGVPLLNPWEWVQ